MKALVATKETQGQRRNDFSWADEGELVTFGSECDGESVDGWCGCRRSMSGLTSLKATTTVKVIESPSVTREVVESKIKEHLERDWGFDEPTAMAAARETATELTRLADSFVVGDVLEKRGRSLRVRENHVHS